MIFQREYHNAHRHSRASLRKILGLSTYTDKFLMTYHTIYLFMFLIVGTRYRYISKYE